jgi:hypothetical protein
MNFEKGVPPRKEPKYKRLQPFWISTPELYQYQMVNCAHKGKLRGALNPSLQENSSNLILIQIIWYPMPFYGFHSIFFFCIEELNFILFSVFDFCGNSPCNNGGTCTSSSSGFSCQCDEITNTGTTCDGRLLFVMRDKCMKYMWIVLD